ncbi:ER lumen protein retaining receptor [Paragonimus westermani]|uniref:ER lumen protein retaining receptor n=1 Tax=Paragonimus westermani TaxID=34504 RepID=A0A5J4P272_9TREM|nr:ER lumen protein retaining receptor [Paragonimus westermani]
MNVFRLAGDLSHLGAILILLLKIYSSRSCKGLSGKTQVMFALVFTTRYLDLFVYYVSAYNTVMKVLFILLSYLTLYLMYHKFKHTLETTDSLFRLPYFIIPIGGLAFLVNHKMELLEVSIYKWLKLPVLFLCNVARGNYLRRSLMH